MPNVTLSPVGDMLPPEILVGLYHDVTIGKGVIGAFQVPDGRAAVGRGVLSESAGIAGDAGRHRGWSSRAAAFEVLAKSFVG